MPRDKSKANGDRINKSQAIRDALNEHPQAKAKQIAAILAERNIIVKPSQIYLVKGRLAQMSHAKKKKAQRATVASQKTGSSDAVALIIKLKALAREAGGMSNLLKLVTVLAD